MPSQGQMTSQLVGLARELRYFGNDVVVIWRPPQFLKDHKVNDCARKETSAKQIVLTCSTVDEYRKLQGILTEETKNHQHKDSIGTISFHTYQIKSERAFIVYLRHLPRTMDPTEICDELQKVGYAVRRVTNVPRKVDGKL